MSKGLKVLMVAVVLAVFAGCSDSSDPTPATNDAANAAGDSAVVAQWMTGDFHNHTTFTDGSWPMNDLIGPATITPEAVADPSILYRQGTAPTGFRNGLDFFTNSEHGGYRERDGFGTAWGDTNVYPVNPAVGDPKDGQMWRWQSLIRTSDIRGYNGPLYMGAYDWIETIRANYPAKIVMTGMEWNVPGHEHASTAIVADNALPIAEFEYRFDNSDSDGTTTPQTADTMGWPGKVQNDAYTVAYSELGLNATHEKAIDAVKWMEENYPKTGYIIPAHIERKGCGGIGNSGYTIAAFRDMNDNGPDVAFGFEGLPGHDKSSDRGEFGTGACGGGTYGGAGIYIAEVGGLWDNLLADGRKFFTFDNSDFHDDGDNSGVDFWPGEYEKTHVKVVDADNDGYTQEDVVAGLHSGNVFVVHGDLISELDFSVLPASGSAATMGETLQVAKESTVTVRIRFKSPEANNCIAGVNASASYVCATPVVHHIQLIQGRVNAAKARKFLADGVTPNPAFNEIDSTVASIVQTFDADSWSTDAEGYTTMTYTVPKVENDMFFRIRGSNLGYGVVKKSAADETIYGTDSEGSPLLNTPGTNTGDMAWDDLWFYSNPIFVKAI